MTPEECAADFEEQARYLRERFPATPGIPRIEAVAVHLRRLAALEAENARLREALERIAGPADLCDPLVFTVYVAAGGGYEGLQALAREALSEGGGGE